MIVTISCEVFARMASIPNTLDASDTRKYFKCLFIERKQNKLFIVATNTKVAAIEYIGENEGPDEYLTCSVDPALVAQCVKETEWNSDLTITENAALKYTSVRSKFGYVYSGNADVQLPSTAEFYKWREWFPAKMATAHKGVMFWSLDDIAALYAACPSTQVRFPQFIDTEKHILINDAFSDKWIGIFIAKIANEIVAPATIPEWVY